MTIGSSDPLYRSKWNFSAIVAVVVLLIVNGIAGAGFLMGLITWQDWLTGTGALNGMALGWVSKELSTQ